MSQVGPGTRPGLCSSDSCLLRWRPAVMRSARRGTSSASPSGTRRLGCRALRYEWATRMKALWSAVGPLAGTIVGFMLGVVSKAVTDRRQAIRAVTRTAGVVLDRLLKLQSASARGDQSVVANELTLLGGDLDRYRDAILASPRHKASHW